MGMRVEVELREDEVEILRKLRSSIGVDDDSAAIRFALHFLDVMLQYPPPSYFGDVVAKVLARLGLIEEYKPNLRLSPSTSTSST